MPFVATTTVPCEGAVLLVTLNPVPASFVSTDEEESVVLAGVVAESPTAFGVTATVTVAVLEWPDESVAV